MHSKLSIKLSVFSLIFSAIFLSATVSLAETPKETEASKIRLLLPGASAPVNSLKDINGIEHMFPASNKWNLVFYWSLFCHSCIEEMPEIQQKLQELKGKDFETYFVALDTDKMQKALQNFVKRRKFSSTVLMECVENEKYVTADTWGVTMTPSVFIIDPKGKIIYSHEGPFDVDIFFKNLPSDLADSVTDASGDKK